MLAVVVRRLLATIPVMIIVAIIVFSLLYLTPGDPAAVLAGEQATAEEIDAADIEADRQHREAAQHDRLKSLHRFTDLPAELRRSGLNARLPAT